MANEVTVSYFVIGLDVVHSYFEPQQFFDYLRTAQRKYVISINAADYVENQGRSSRSSTNGKERTGPIRSIVKGIANKIKTEHNKLVEMKRKFLIQEEKKLQKLMRSSKGDATMRAKPVTTELPKIYEGETEVVFIIHGFPYTKTQIKLLSEQVDIGAFIALVNNEKPAATPPTSGKKQPEKSNRSSTSSRASTSGKASASNRASTSNRNSMTSKVLPLNRPSPPNKVPTGKKASIPGVNLDSLYHPGEVPPPRWDSIKPKANANIAFSQINVPTSLEETWNVLQHEVARIIRCRREFDEHFKDHKFISIPKVDPKKDMSFYSKYIKQHHNDIVNAIINQLKNNNWKTALPPKPISEKEKYLNLFKEITAKTLRLKVSTDKEEQSKPFIELNHSNVKSLYDILYKLLKWKLNDETAAVNKAVIDFYTNYENINAVAGHRYESMLSNANKKFLLSLPISFLDWSNFQYSHEYENVTEVLIHAAKENFIFDTFLEEPAGILWIMALPPVSRIVGQPIKYFYIPPSIDGISEWLNKVYNITPPTLEGKGRNLPTPAQVLKNNISIETLLPSIINRTSNPENNVYKIPLSDGNSVEYISPYFFHNGIRAEITRNIVRGIMTFGYHSQFPNGFEIQSNYDTVNIVFHEIGASNYQNNFERPQKPEDEIRIFFNNDFTILKNKTSIVYQNHCLYLKSKQDYIISQNGDLIFEQEGFKIILEKTGRIGKYINNTWIYTEPDGYSYYYDEEYKKVQVPHMHKDLTDIGTGLTRVIREDGLFLSYYQDGDRIITFNPKFIVRQMKDSIIFEIPDFPYITYRDSSFIFLLNGTNFVLDQHQISINNDSASILRTQEEIKIESLNSEIYISPGVFQMKVLDLILYADKTGTQRIGPLEPPTTPKKRKVEVVHSKWGNVQLIKESHLEATHLNLLSMNRPRFFAVRPNLSATEYVHQAEVQHYLNQYIFKTDPTTKDWAQWEDICEQRTKKAKRVNNFQIVSLHAKGYDPLIYFEQKPLDKVARAALLRTLQVPKKSRSQQRNQKGKKEEDPNMIINAAKESHQKHLQFFHQVYEIQQSALGALESEYREDIRPKTPPPPEIIEPPVFTPSPRLLEMMHMKHAMTATSYTPLNYWDSPEAEFAYPIKAQPVLPRPLSPRTKLFDMPRGDQKNNDPPPDINDYIPQKTHKSIFKPILSNLSPRRSSGRVYQTEVSRPQTAGSGIPKRKVDFGIVSLGKTVSASFDIQNTGTKPLHYTVTYPENKDVEINTLPGTVMPGLKVKIQLTLHARKIGQITTSFDFKSPLGDLSIPVSATIIDPSTILRDADDDVELQL